jgi:glutaminyl-tRNA synthetase
LSIGKEVRLRNAYIVKAIRFETDQNGEISTVYCTYDAKTLGTNPSDGRKVKGVIHFVEASEALEAAFRIYDCLFLDPNPGNFDDFAISINPDSLKIYIGFVEPYLLNAEAEKAYQFERVGYFCRDNKLDGLVFNKTVSLRDSYK